LSYNEEVSLVGQDTNDFFGKSISVYENKVAIAQNKKVTVYENISGDVWEIDGFVSGGLNRFGFNIELSDGQLAVATGDGHVKTYKYSPGDDEGKRWIDGNYGVISGSTDSFGTGIKYVDEDTIIVSDPNDNSVVKGGGLVCKFEVLSGNWFCDEAVTIPNIKSNDFVGASLDANSSYVVAGAPGRNVRSRTNVGEVFVFNAGNLNLPPIKILQPEVIKQDSKFGSDVSINSSNNILVGAYNEKVKKFRGVGTATIFTGGTWDVVKVISPSENIVNGEFGRHVELLNGGKAFIGQPGYDVPAHNQGRIFFFNDIVGSDIFETIELSFSMPTAQIGKVFNILTQDSDIIIGIENFSSNNLQNHGIVVGINVQSNELVFFGEEQVLYGLEEVFYKKI
jgi:hypothetical protein